MFVESKKQYDMSDKRGFLFELLRCKEVSMSKKIRKVANAYTRRGSQIYGLKILM